MELTVGCERLFASKSTVSLCNLANLTTNCMPYALCTHHQVSNGNSSFSSSGVRFSYHARVELLSSDPPSGSAGTRVLLTGLNVANTSALACRFGAALPVPAAWLSATSALCSGAPERSAAGASTVALDLSLNGGSDFSASGLSFAYDAPLRLTLVWPSRGGAGAGGTVVMVRGANFPRGAGALACHFGGTPAAAVAWISDGEALLVAPPHAPGLVTLRCSSNGGADYSAESALSWRYVADVSIQGVVPGAVLVGGGVPLWVRGANFVNTTELACRVGSSVVRGHYIGPSVMVCLAPAHSSRERLQRASGVFPLDVTVNGQVSFISGAAHKCSAVVYVCGVTLCVVYRLLHRV
jgi:IPT/TIG domain